MGNVVRRLLRRKEDYAKALVQMADEMVSSEESLRKSHQTWRSTLYRLTYLAIIVEIAYATYWYFLTPPNPPAIDAAVHILIMASIPPLWYLFVLLIGALFRYRIGRTEEKMADMRSDYQKKLEEFKEKGTYKEVSSVMAQLEAKTPRRGGMGPHASRAKAPATEPRPQRPVSSTPYNQSKTNATHAPSTGVKKPQNEISLDEKSSSGGAAQKRPNASSGDKHDNNNNNNSSASAAKEGSENETSSGDLSDASSGGNNVTHTGEGSNGRGISTSTSGGGMSGANPHLSTPAMPSTAIGRPLTQAPNTAQREAQRLHLNPVPQSPYKPQYYGPPSHHSRGSSSSSSSPTASNAQPKSWMDWFVDKLVGSEATTPKICAFCGAHNGLVPVDELANVRFVCHNCKSFNSNDLHLDFQQKNATKNSAPASAPATTSAPQNASSSSSSSSTKVIEQQTEPKEEELVPQEKEEKEEDVSSEN